MQFTDAVTVAGTRRTGDGYLVAEARCVRTGIQLYGGSEVGVADKAIVRVYRPPEEVFAQDSLQSFSHAPVTMDHPAEAVSSENWKALSVGEVSTAAKQDGNWVMLPLILKDAKAIAAVEAGKRELSAGYVCQLEMTPGITADGEAYDAIQKGIKINHLALVDRARAGSQARIGDAGWGASPITEDKGLAPITKSKTGDTMSDALKTVVLGDKAVQVAVTDVAAIEAFKADTAKAMSDAKAAHDTVLAAKDAELATKDAKIADLEKQVLTPDALDAKVQARSDLIDAAKKVAPKIETKGLSDADIRKAAVVAVRGADAVKDKSEAYIDAAFDLLKDTKPADPVRQVLQSGIHSVGDARTEASQARIQRDQGLRDAWKPADTAA